MKPKLKWIVARLGEDMNWWVDQTSDEVYWGSDPLSILDPNQVNYLREALQKYEEFGFDPRTLANAFHLFEASSELPDGRLRLAPSKQGIADEDVQLFALPDLLDAEHGAYPDLLDHLSTLRIKFLNATHDYHEDVTELDMDEDIQARNADRYFSASAIHSFNELEDILTWKPAEWEEEEAAMDKGDEEDEDERKQ